MNKVQWGVLGTSMIALNRVIPAMQAVSIINVVAIASRDHKRAQEVAAKVGIEKAYGSYEGLLADPSIDAVYIPLPNHLHIEWCLKALAAGKHVLCEKPVAMDAQEAELLLEARAKSGRLIEEAFAIRNHPQWTALRQVIESGEIGAVRGVQTVMCYNNRNPNDIRNIADIGGGALYDIGSYAVAGCRMVFGDEPTRAFGLFEMDPEFHTDRLTSAILEFPSGQATILLSTQAAPRPAVRTSISARLPSAVGFGPTSLMRIPCHRRVIFTSATTRASARNTRARFRLRPSISTGCKANGSRGSCAGRRYRHFRLRPRSRICVCSTPCVGRARAADSKKSERVNMSQCSIIRQSQMKNQHL